MASVIAASKGVKEEAYRNIYVDVELAEHSTERANMDVIFY